MSQYSIYKEILCRVLYLSIYAIIIDIIGSEDYPSKL